MDSSLFLFYYSIVMQVAAILTAAGCFASYLVSRNNVQLFSFIGFLMYYIDCMLVFRDDYVMYASTSKRTLSCCAPPQACYLWQQALP